MKKVSWSYILFQILIVALMAVFTGLSSCFVVSNAMEDFAYDFVSGSLLFSGIAFFFFIIGWFVAVVGGDPGKGCEITMDEGSKANNFKQSHLFTSSNALIKVDGVDGRVGYVAKLNPKQFQLANASEFTEIKSGHTPSPLGGTTYVYFSFKYKGSTYKIPTFTSDKPKSLTNEKVQRGVALAEKYANILKEASQK